MSTQRLIANPLLKKGLQFVTVESDYPQVDTYNDLLAVSSPVTNDIYIVRTDQGTRWWIPSFYAKGFYRYNGTSWDHLGRVPNELPDSTTSFYDEGDTSRIMKFDLGSITTGTTRTLTIPNKSGTLALTANETFTGLTSFAGTISPISTFTITGGATTNASRTITYDANTVIKAGDKISGTGIPLNTIVRQIVSSTSAIISAAATATGSGLTFTVQPIAIAVRNISTLSNAATDPSAALYINPVFTNNSVVNRSLLIFHNVTSGATANAAVEVASNTSETLLRFTGGSLMSTEFNFGIGVGGITSNNIFYFAQGTSPIYTATTGGFSFTAGIPLTGGSNAASLNIGGGYGSTAGVSVRIGSATASGQGGVTATTGNYVFLGVGGAGLSNQQFVVSSGSASLTGILVDTQINQTGSATGTIRGYYYNPSVTSILGSHYAIESTSGDWFINNSTGSGKIVMNDSSGTAKTALSTGLNNLILGNAAWTNISLSGTNVLVGSYMGFTGNIAGSIITLGWGGGTQLGSNNQFTGISFLGNYAPTTSGTGFMKYINLGGIVNQTLASNQSVFMIDINPTLTSVLGTVYGVRSRIGNPVSGSGSVWNIYADGVAPNYFAGNVILEATVAHYYGDPSIDGTWRTIRSGNNLLHERREAGVWVTKQTITP